MKALPSRRRWCRADLPADGGEEAVLRGDRALAGVEHHEGAGAVGALGLADARSRPGRTAPPADRRDAVDRDAVGQAGDAAGAPKRAVHGRTSREDLDGDAEQLAQLAVPAAALQRPQERARGVAGLGDVGRAGGEAPHEVGVDGAGGELARAARARAPSTWSRTHASLVAEK
jgi:hypothetical protein